MTLAIDGTSPAEVNAASGNATTASFTAPAGSLLVALADAGSTLADGDVGSSISDSGGLTWHLIGRQRGAGYDEAVAWWAAAPSATSRTVTVTATTNTLYKFLQLLVVTGADTTTPIGDVDQGNVPSGTLSASITSSAAGSMALAAYADWDAAAEPTAGTGATLISAWQQNSTGAALRRTALASAAAETMTVATSAPTAKIAYVLFEVLAATGGGSTQLGLDDTFTGSAGALDTPGRTDIDWDVISGSITVDGSGHVTGDSAGDLDVARTVDALPTTGMRVEVDVSDLPSGTGRSVGVWARMGLGSEPSGYSAEVDRVSGTFVIIRWIDNSTSDNINGGFGTLAVDPGAAFTLALQVDTDDSIRVYIDDQIIWQGTDPIDASALAGNTRAGWSTYNSDGNVEVTEFRASNLGDSAAHPAAIRLRLRMPTPAALVDLDQVTGLIARWNVADLVLAEGDPVSSWTPSAGLEAGVDAVNVGSFRPTYRGGVGPTGGPALRFLRSSSQSLHAYPWSDTYDTPITTIIVWRPASLDARAELLSGVNTPYIHVSHLPLTLSAGAGAPDEIADPTVIANNIWHVSAVVFDGAASKIYHDSLTATASGTTSTTAANAQAGLTGVNIGTNVFALAGFVDAWIAEVLILNRAAGPAEMAGLMGSIAQSYDLSWAPAPGEEGPPDPPPSGGGSGTPPTDEAPATYWNTDAPRPRIGVVFDSGPTAPLTLPINPAEGPYLTFEQGPGALVFYTPGANTVLDVVSSVFMVLAGGQSMTMTRTGSTGTASWQLILYLDTFDMTGRTYLIWMPIKQADGVPPRTATFTAAWQTDSGGSLGTPDSHTQTEGDGYVSGEGFTWLGLLTTAPSTRPGRLVIQLDIAGVEVGEIHHVDAWFPRYYGVELGARLRDRPGETRGRSDDLQRFEAGTGALLLRNDDGQLTPGGTGYPIGLRNQVTMLWEWQGNLYPHLVGYTGEPENVLYLDGISDVRLPFTDLFDVLSGRKLWPPYQSDVLYDEPAGYLPMSEQQGSTAAGSIAGGGGVGILRPSSAGGGGSTFGAQTFEPLQNSTHRGDGDITCLSLNPNNPTGSAGDILDVSTVPGALPDGTTPWVLELRFQQDDVSGVQILWRNTADVLGLLTAFQIDMDGSTGHISVTAWTGSTWAPIMNTSGAYDDNGPRTLEFKYDPDGGGAYGTARIRIGNEVVSHTLTADPWAPGVPVHAYLGGAYIPDDGTVGNAWTGFVGHLALWTTSVSDFRLDLHQSVISGGFSELEKSRIEGLLQFAGISQAYARVAGGLTVLLAAHRTGQSPVLGLLQDAAAAAGGYVFMGADGRIAYHNRLRRNFPFPRFVFDGDMAPLVGSVSPRFNRGRLANVITVKRTGGGEYRIVDAASVALHDEVEAPSVELPIASETEVQEYGKAVVRARSIPRTEIRSLEWAATGKPELISALLRLEIGDFITAGDLPDVAGTDTVAGFVEQIETSSDGSLTDMRWRVSLSPATAQVIYGEIPNVTPPPPPVDPPDGGTDGPGGGGTGGWWPSGGSVDTNGESTSDEWGSWRGRTVDLCLCFNTRDSGWGPFMPNTGQPAAYHGSGHRLMIQTSPFPELMGNSYGALISGAYDDLWAQWANYLETADNAAGRAPSIVNIAWEANGSYFPWGYRSGYSDGYNSPGEYIGGWERIRDILKANYPSVKCGWVMNLHQNPMDSGLILPNPAKIDYIGVDYYDMFPPSPNHDAFLSLANEPNGGVLWYLGLVRQYGKLLSVPEWGVVNQSDGNGGGDSANYVNWMVDDVFANAHASGHMGGETYFTYPPSDLRNGSNPNAAAQYVARYHT